MESQKTIKNYWIYQFLGWLFLALIFAAVVSIVYYQQMKSLPVGTAVIHKNTNISSYTACVNAGYSIVKGEPEKCQTNEGLTFTRYEGCIQVVTKAQDAKTGKVGEFPTPCDVPEGWVEVN